MRSASEVHKFLGDASTFTTRASGNEKIDSWVFTSHAQQTPSGIHVPAGAKGQHRMIMSESMTVVCLEFCDARGTLSTQPICWFKLVISMYLPIYSWLKRVSGTFTGDHGHFFSTTCTPRCKHSTPVLWSVSTNGITFCWPWAWFTRCAHVFWSAFFWLYFQHLIAKVQRPLMGLLACLWIFWIFPVSCTLCRF